MSANFPVKVTFSAVDNLTAEVHRINQKIQAASAPTQSLASRFKDLGNALQLPAIGESFGKVRDSAKKLGSDLASVAKTAGAVGLAVGGTAFALVKHFTDAADGMVNTADRIGIGVEALQEYRFAAGQSGMETEELDKSLGFLSKNTGLAALGKGPALGAFKKLGIQIKDSSGRMKSMEELLPALADKFKGIQDPSVRAALATQLFGKEGAKMGLVLSQGSEEIEAMRKQARDLGLVMGRGSLEKARAFDDTLKKVMATVEAIGFRIASDLLPVFQKLADEFLAWAIQNGDTIDAFAETFRIALDAVVGVAKFAFGILGSLSRWFTSLPAWARMAAINGLMLAFAAIMGGKVLVSTASLAVNVFALTKQLGSLSLTLLNLIPSFRLGFSLALSSGARLIPAFIAGLYQMVSAFAATGVAMIAHPLFWIPAAIAAVVGAIYLLWKNWDAVSNFFKSNFDMKDAFLAVLGPIGWLIMAARKVIQHWAPIKEFFAGLIPDSLRGLFGGVSVSGTATGAPAGAQAAMGAITQSQQSGQASVKVDFTNLPRGAQVSTGAKNDAPLDLGLGYAGVF